MRVAGGISGFNGLRASYAAVALMIGLTAVSAARADDPIEEFYKGRRMEMIIHVQPGGSYDLYARLVARRLPRHIPGADSGRTYFAPRS